MEMIFSQEAKLIVRTVAAPYCNQSFIVYFICDISCFKASSLVSLSVKIICAVGFYLTTSCSTTYKIKGNQMFLKVQNWTDEALVADSPVVVLFWNFGQWRWSCPCALDLFSWNLLNILEFLLFLKKVNGIKFFSKFKKDIMIFPESFV